MFIELSADEDSRSRLVGDVMTNRNRNARTLASYIPVATALVGVTIVLGQRRLFLRRK